jgi:hypothetical protein
LQWSLEQWVDEIEETKRSEEQYRQQQQRLQVLEYEIEKAHFEYHVLKNRTDMDIVAMKRPADGSVAIYAVSNKEKHTVKPHDTGTTWM